VKLAMDIIGPASMVAQAFPYELDETQRSFLFKPVRDHLRRLQ